MFFRSRLNKPHSRQVTRQLQLTNGQYSRVVSVQSTVDSLLLGAVVD